MIYGNALMPGGSGKVGATLTITAPAGSTVTIEKDGESYSSTLLPAVFKGLSTGEWQRTAKLDGRISTKLIDIVADYSDNVEFFSAVIEISYPAGSRCTATDGIIVLNAPDTSGTWTLNVSRLGAWQISCTDEVYTVTDTAQISEEGQHISLALAYKVMLLDGANTFDDVTGGWSGYKTLDENGIYLEGPSTGYTAGTKSAAAGKITPRGSCTKLCAIVSMAENNGWGTGAGKVYNRIKFGAAGIDVPASSAEQTVSFELGTLQEAWISIVSSGGFYDGTNMYAKIRVKKMWLE